MTTKNNLILAVLSVSLMLLFSSTAEALDWFTIDQESCASDTLKKINVCINPAAWAFDYRQPGSNSTAITAIAGGEIDTPIATSADHKFTLGIAAIAGLQSTASTNSLGWGGGLELTIETSSSPQFRIIFGEYHDTSKTVAGAGSNLVGQFIGVAWKPK